MPSQQNDYPLVATEGATEVDPSGEYSVDTHKLGTCLRFANGETCIGCGDEKNGEPLNEPKWIECPICRTRFADATGTAHDLSQKPAAPIAPAAELIADMRDALQSVLNLDLVREKSWLPGSYGEAVVAAAHESVARAASRPAPTETEPQTEQAS